MAHHLCQYRACENHQVSLRRLLRTEVYQTEPEVIVILVEVEVVEVGILEDYHRGPNSEEYLQGLVCRS